MPTSPSVSASAKGFPVPKLSEKGQLIVVIGVSVLCGLVASAAAFKYLNEQRRTIAADLVATPKTVSVVIARQDLEPGSALSRLNLEAAEWPADHQPPRGFSQTDAAAGRQVLTKIFRGEPIVESRLVPQGEHAGLHIKIPDGMLGMSIKVDPEIGVSGFIQTGNHVDVIATMRMAHGDQVTRVVLQNILVLAVGQIMESENEKPNEPTTVTLAVTPQQAEKLASVKTEGGVMLALRNLHDDRTYETPGISLSQLADQGALSSHDKTADQAKQPEVTPGKPQEETKSAEQEAEEVAAKEAKTHRIVELIEAESVSKVKFKN